MVLANLQRSVTSGHPPVRPTNLHIGFPYIIIHIFRLKQMNNVCFGRYFRLHIVTEYITTHDAVFCSDNQVRTFQIKIHQCTVHYFLGTLGFGKCQGIIRQKFRCQLRSGVPLHRLPFQFRILCHRSIIICQWCEQTKIIGIRRNITWRHRQVVQII